MSEIAQCVTCSKTLERRPGRGRPARWCSATCRRTANTARMQKGSDFGRVRISLQDIGEDKIRERMVANPDFAEQVLDIVDRFLPMPEGRERVSVSPEVADLVFESYDERRFTITGRDTPLTSSADIDEAEATGDWSKMTTAALKSMTWQFEHGYRPDLRFC